MKAVKLAALAAISCCALMLAAAGPAAAAQTAAPKFTQKVKVTGTKGFKGTYTIERFVRSGNAIKTVGTLKGTLRGKKVRKENVRMPATLGAAPASSAQLPPTPGSCSVLNLVLGPIDLNLLGLRVRTNEIDLRIEAVPSTGGAVPGGLLGDLLCGITNLLNPTANTPLGQLTQLLNALLALSPRG
jgi:hypothetical protein